MTASTEITDPQDLAQTVRNAVDPLDEQVGYGAGSYWSEDGNAHVAGTKQQLGDRSASSTRLGAACEDYVVAHPIRSVAVAAGAGAACVALIYLLINRFDDE